MTPVKLTAGVAALLLTATLAACTDEPDDNGTSSGSSTQSASSAAPADRSDDVFSAARRPKVLATTSGTVNLGVGKGIRQFEEDVTFDVTGVRATSDGTVLSYQLTADDGSAIFGLEGRYWYDQPSLRLPGSTTRMQSVTAALPKGERDPARDVCVCTSASRAGKNPTPQRVLYDQVPDGTEEIEVILPGLEPVTVPVTR